SRPKENSPSAAAGAQRDRLRGKTDARSAPLLWPRAGSRASSRKSGLGRKSGLARIGAAAGPFVGGAAGPLAAGGGAAPRVPDGGGAGSRAGALLPARRAAGHEPRLRAPHTTEPDRSVPPRPTATPDPARPGPARPAGPDSRPAPRRDDYDKKVKQAKEKARRRHTPAPTRPRKPDLQVYLPRRRDGSTHPGNPDCEEFGESSSSGGSELEPSGHQLFCLEYESDNGEVTSVIVYQDDDPGRVSEEVSAHTPLDLPMREALKLRIQEEIAKRQNRH
uniref:Uncharacterized protein n=1 Tax=Urocitellus parryii TaxID=9999 RepID=A0A8D2GM82_UROPR